MGISTIPTFKAGLITRLAADAALGAASPPVQIAYGLPHNGLDGDAVLVGNTRPEDPTAGDFPGGQSSAPYGQGSREERYVLELVVRVDRDIREPQQAVTERAFAIAGSIETSLRSWRTAAPVFGGLVRWALVANCTHTEGITENGNTRGTRVFIDIACSARI
jgi:hypothetical protein